MTVSRLAALAALLSLSAATAAYADSGLIAAGCPAGQTFTAGSISVTGAYLRATPPAAQSAGAYLVIPNAGPEADTFTGATTSAAGDTALHQMSMNGQVMQMSDVAGGLPVPAGGSVSLDPMGYHLMLTGLSAPFKQGQCLGMVLHFAKAGDLDIELNIGSITQNGPPAAPSGASIMPSSQTAMPSMSMPM